MRCARAQHLVRCGVWGLVLGVEQVCIGATVNGVDLMLAPGRSLPAALLIAIP